MTQSVSFLARKSVGAMAAPWLQASIIAGMIHISFATSILFATLIASSATEDFGIEDAVEFAPHLISATGDMRPDASDVEQLDRVAVPKLEETLSTRREVDLPVEQAAPVDVEEPDLRFAQERTHKELEDRNEKKQTTEALEAQDAAVSSRMSVATASVAHQDAIEIGEKTAAPDIGSTREIENRIAEWQRKLFAHISKHKHYPDEARSKNIKGEIIVAFAVDRAGVVSDVSIARSSGSPILDRAAIDVMNRANPLPKPPADFRRERMNLTLPMRFQIK